jgi:hypothetical protein
MDRGGLFREHYCQKHLFCSYINYGLPDLEWMEGKYLEMEHTVKDKIVYLDGSGK